MSTFVDFDKPPFFTTIYLTPRKGEDPGLYSDAVSTMISTAMLLAGFIGFTDDVAEADQPVKIIYWRTFHGMRTWRRTARDLLPYRIDIDNCVASEGCHWKWFEKTEISDGHAIRYVA